MKLVKTQNSETAGLYGTFEQAIIKQSSRLVKEYGNTKIDKSIVSLLSADDFDINAAKVYKTEKIAIGF